MPYIVISLAFPEHDSRAGAIVLHVI